MTEIQGNIHPLASMALGQRPANAVAARALVVLWLTVASGCSSNSAKPLPGSGGAVATTSDAAMGTGGVAIGTGGVAIGTGGMVAGAGGSAAGSGGAAAGTGGVAIGDGGSVIELSGYDVKVDPYGTNPLAAVVNLRGVTASEIQALQVVVTGLTPGIA